MRDQTIAQNLHWRDHHETGPWQWGRDFGKDILTDLNMLAHARGTDATTRDALKRAYSEITRLRKLVTTQEQT